MTCARFAIRSTRSISSTAEGNAYVHMPIERLRRALDNRYVYLRRQDLERILANRARDRASRALRHVDRRPGRARRRGSCALRGRQRRQLRAGDWGGRRSLTRARIGVRPGGAIRPLPRPLCRGLPCRQRRLPGPRRRPHLRGDRPLGLLLFAQRNGDGRHLHLPPRRDEHPRHRPPRHLARALPRRRLDRGGRAARL